MGGEVLLFRDGGVIFFGRGDIFSGGVGNFLVSRLEIFRVGLGIIWEAGLTFFREGVAIFLGGVGIFWEGLRFFQKG